MGEAVGVGRSVCVWGGARVDTDREARTRQTDVVPRIVYIMKAPSWPTNISGCLRGTKRPSACLYTSRSLRFHPPTQPPPQDRQTAKTENKWSTVSNQSHIFMETSFCQVSDWLSAQIVRTVTLLVFQGRPIYSLLAEGRMFTPVPALHFSS